MASISDSSEWFYGKQFDLAVEIGTRYGESTLVLNSNASIKRLVTIDPYLQYEDYEHDGQWKNSTNETYEKNKIHTLTTFKYRNGSGYEFRSCRYV